MNRRAMQWVALTLATVAAASPGVPARAQATKYDKPPAFQLSAEDRQALEGQTAELERLVARLPRAEGPNRDALADVAVYAKAGTWALRYEEFYTKKDVAMTLDVLGRGQERARALA